MTDRQQATVDALARRWPSVQIHPQPDGSIVAYALDYCPALYGEAHGLRAVDTVTIPA